MNFYTFFKKESKKDCDYFNLEFPESPINLWHYRKNLLLFAFHCVIPLSVFQVACFRVVPLDMPINDYSILYDYFFRKNGDTELYLTDSLIKIAHSLTITIFEILFEDEVKNV